MFNIVHIFVSVIKRKKSITNQKIKKPKFSFEMLEADQKMKI